MYVQLVIYCSICFSAHINWKLYCRNMDLMHTKRTKGVKSLVIDGHAYRMVNVLKNKVKLESPWMLIYIVLSRHRMSITMQQMTERLRQWSSRYNLGNSQYLNALTQRDSCAMYRDLVDESRVFLTVEIDYRFILLEICILGRGQQLLT